MLREILHSSHYLVHVEVDVEVGILTMMEAIAIVNVENGQHQECVEFHLETTKSIRLNF